MSKKWLRFALLLSIICDIIGTTKTEQRKEFKSRRNPALFLCLFLSLFRFPLLFIPASVLHTLFDVVRQVESYN